MGMTLPGELVSLLGMLGYTWPEADETKLLEMGQAWLAFPDRLRTPVADADRSAQQMWTQNRDDAIERFQTSWQAADSAKTNLDDGASAAALIGTGLMVCAGIVLALKINVIVQLTLLAIQIAQAVATAAVTFGASLLEIPIFKLITGVLIDQLLNMATEAVLGG
ncbi:hypothetical protein J5U46_15405 [Micromonospora tulbaghiae]|uniref:Outer membrane channel protein CpnT-like N-terminal domain-containing protein n=1 Tax=Micromonospora tulbaghiae TaxID=479978 RepID=A0AAW4JRV5_9ACTN|nr:MULTISPECIES: hypothetical protein [Micromonospora]KAB1908415.1 hypothetical protein F8279_07180 [Micromonospora sp. AMSO1212t]MBO4141541.1 hypothetical protein [Micromonospora tulbaghiae]MDX5459113.1 hypothetical protein [Micromonospora tulbaghiae]SCF11028.1 hypothetical protein GA0070562_0216 [Micromonospora tulbaghiae]